MSDELGPLKYGQGMFKTCTKLEKPAKLRWYTNPPALLITYGRVSGNEKLVYTIRRAQSPKIAMNCGRDTERCSGQLRYNSNSESRFNFSRRSWAFRRQGFMATGTQLGWQLWLLFLILSTSLISTHGSKLERRELPSLSPTDMTRLVTATDPLFNLDPSNPNSHLSKILIPRPGMPLLSLGHELL